MAKILADRDIRKLMGAVILDAEEDCLSPNGIRLRLGGRVRFLSTDEEKELPAKHFLKVNPGEVVQVSSKETIDFSAATVHRLYPGQMLMGLITPTTTMMREGVLQAATKIDAGFRGRLNWGLRNSSTKPLVLEQGEPIFKMTVFLLDKDESPDTPYGERDADKYQDTNGIRGSSRRIPADLPKGRTVASSVEKLDPKKHLSEAGYPFDHISTELTELHGKFEIVSTDVRLLKDHFESRTDELSAKISSETRTLSQKMDSFAEHCFEKVESIFDRKFLRTVGVIVGAISLLYGVCLFLKGASVGEPLIAGIAFVVGLAICAVAYVISRRAA